MGTSKLVIVFCLLHLSSSSTTTGVLAAFRRESFSYNDGFSKGRDEKFFEFLGDHATIYSNALQLTPETLNDQFIDIHYNKSGRILYHKPFTLWLSSDNDEDEVLASFTSTFVINIYREATWNAGHGLAFLIAPDLSIPVDSYGQWLGLTNATTDGNPTNRIIAIEFDTEKQDPFDPDDNHIGLNINSVKSNKTISLDDYNITISPEEGTNYMVWVQYDGLSKRLEVYMVKEGEQKPQQPLLNETINLKDYVKQESYFGFAASTGKPQIELNCVLKWSLEIDSLPNEKDLTWLKISVGVGAPFITIVLVLCAAAVYVNRKRRARLQDVENSEFGKLRWLPGMPREFRYKALKKATNNFHISMKLGEGGFGVVYRGLLHDREEPHSHSENITEIAVKKFSRDNINGKDDFLAELTIIHRLRHKHLVRLLGWCYEKRKLLLVYDFMPNGSLEKHLYEASGQTTLNWSHRNKILIGLTSALHYLHNECDQKVVHRDLKASNVLLDEDFNARLGDFGLARALEKDRNSYAELDLGGVPGTIGYVAPECFHTGKATPESDVFGFGAVVLEVVCGRNPGAKVHHDQHLYSLVDWVWMLHRERRINEAVDARLQNDFDINGAERLLLLGLACSHPIHIERPTTLDIVQIISGAMPAPRVSPFKPVFTWPSIDMTTATSITDDSVSSITLSAQYSLRIQRINSLPRASSHLPV